MYTVRWWIPDVLNGPVSNKMYDFAARGPVMFDTRCDAVSSTARAATTAAAAVKTPK